MSLKKTKKADSRVSNNEGRRKEEIIQMQTLFAEGYSKKEIARILKTWPKRVRKYLQGDPENLSKHGNKNIKRHSILDEYTDKIQKMLSDKIPYKDILEALKSEGYTGGQTILYYYCGSLKKDINVNTDNKSKVIKRFVKKQDLIKHIWSSKEMDEKDRIIIYDKYPDTLIIEECVKDFRDVFIQKTTSSLHNFIEKYIKCSISNLKSFANGLIKDISAVEQAVISPYSNGVTEGNNHRLKLIKRLMYGRAKLPLLRAKVIPCSIFYTH